MKEKQIEEMAKDLYGMSIDTEADCKYVAEVLYTAGYRKQSVGEWRFLKNMMCECSVCNDCFNYYSSTDLPNFCSGCGAKMKGGAE